MDTGEDSKFETFVENLYQRYLLEWKIVERIKTKRVAQHVNEHLRRLNSMALSLHGKYLKHNKTNYLWKINNDRSAKYEVSASKNNNCEVMEWLASHM